MRMVRVISSLCDSHELCALGSHMAQVLIIRGFFSSDPCPRAAQHTTLVEKMGKRFKGKSRPPESLADGIDDNEVEHAFGASDQETKSGGCSDVGFGSDSESGQPCSSSASLRSGSDNDDDDEEERQGDHDEPAAGAQRARRHSVGRGARTGRARGSRAVAKRQHAAGKSVALTQRPSGPKAARTQGTASSSRAPTRIAVDELASTPKGRKRAASCKASCFMCDEWLAQHRPSDVRLGFVCACLIACFMIECCVQECIRGCSIREDTMFMMAPRRFATCDEAWADEFTNDVGESEALGDLCAPCDSGLKQAFPIMDPEKVTKENAHRHRLQGHRERSSGVPMPASVAPVQSKRSFWRL